MGYELSHRIVMTKRAVGLCAVLAGATTACTAELGSLLSSSESDGGGASSTNSGSGTASGSASGGPSGDPSGGPNGDPTGGSSGGSSGSPTGSAQPVSLPGAPLYTRFFRLTNAQWENSVQDILRLSEPTGLSDDFLHAVSGTTDFDNNERVVIVNNTIWADLERAAETIAKQVTATDAALQQVVATDDPQVFIERFGRRAFRRDLTDAEVASYVELFQVASSFSGTQSDFTKGAGLVIEAMLQSPLFLYRTELVDDGTPLTGYELAAKLSLWILDTTPTDAILDAARDGAFDTPEGAAEQAAQMLDDPASAAMMRKFNNQLYKIDVIDTIEKTGVMDYDPALVPEFKEASYRFFDRIFAEDLSLGDVFTSTVGFAGPTMARVYDLPVQGSTIQQVDMPDRSGFFSQPAFLALWAINNDPDSIHRGVRINLDVLCADPGTPAGAIPAVPALEPDQTNRERYEELTRGCGGRCHNQIINPVGFAFENFDGLGRYRETDNGKPVDASGTYTFVEGSETFSGASELMNLIAQGAQAQQCFAKKLASYAMERDIIDSERPLVEALGQVGLEGGSLKDVMLALVQSESFRNHVGGGK